MKKGQVWRDRQFTFTDSVSGKQITRLTDYLGHSSTQYFTNDFWPSESSFVFTSDRENSSNLFRYDLADKRIVQMTELHGEHRPYGVYSRARGKLYFAYGPELFELDPWTLEQRPVHRIADGRVHTGMNAVTADGRYICTCVQEAPDLRGAMHYNKSPDYLEQYGRKPLSKIVRIDIDTGRVETVHEERYFVQHVNANPVDSGMLSFCHEGPWARIDQRIWGLEIDTGRVWKIRPQDERDAAIGHEYFLPDGRWIGYHGRRRPDEKMHFFGATRIDNSERYEIDFPHHCTHFISFGHEIFLGDGTPANVQPWFPSNQKPYLMLFKKEGDRYEGPRVLAYHRATFNEQNQHPHASFTPDGRQVIYTSDMGGYSNVYLVSVDGFESLPTVEECSVEWGAPTDIAPEENSMP